MYGVLFGNHACSRDWNVWSSNYYMSIYTLFYDSVYFIRVVLYLRNKTYATDENIMSSYIMC